MKNILYISHTSQLGGAEHSLLVLLERLDRARFNPAVVTPGDGPLVERLDALDIPCYGVPLFRLRRTRNPFPLLRFFFGYFRARKRIARLIDEVEADIVHCNSTTAFLFGSVRGRTRQAPVIWHVRDVRLTGFRGIDRALVRAASAIIVVSETIRGSVRQVRGAAEKTTVVFNGVDTAQFAPGDRAALRDGLGPGDSTPVAGIVGQVVPWKGHDRFLAAAAKVAARLPDARFLVVGDNRFGDHPKLLDKLRAQAADLGLGDVVIFTGWRDDTAAVMNALDVLVVASENEPFGRVVIEAMACETPVVAFRCGGPAEIIEHDRTGLLVEPFDVDAMADAVTALLADQHRAAALGRAARQAVCEKFSADRYVQSIQDLYDRLLQ